MGVGLLRLASFLALIASVSPAVQTSKGQQTNGDLKFANFKVHNGAYLNITSVGTDLVQRASHCAFACVDKEPCFSFNLATFPDVNNKLLCELLPSDKYINSDKFISNKLYYHYSIPSPCSSEPCKNNGTCVPLYQTNSYKCRCTKTYTGRNCEEVDNNCSCLSGPEGKQRCKLGYLLAFPQQRSIENYAMKNPAILSDLRKFSLCFFTNLQPGHSVFSYAKETANDIYVGLWPSQPYLFIKDSGNALANAKLRHDNGAWYHYCFTWENINGEYKVYRDGQLKIQGVDLKKGGIIKSGGIIVLGQDQDTIGGGFGLGDAFGGQLTELNIWDKVLSDSDVAAQYTSCSIPKGSVLAWSVFKNLIHGNVKVEEQ